jgi:putative ABC transport system substrate-binding protein
VGVIYRPALEGFVKEQVELARIEKVSLVSIAIEGSPGPRKIRRSLHRLVMKEDVDAIWVLNDNALLKPDSIRDAWMPEIKRSSVPVLVGVSSLVNSQLSFGSLAVVPDHSALGVQAANLLFELADEDWQLDDREVELPLSVETVVDMSQKDLLKLSEESARLIDRAVL